jgi:hypothetical protein
LRKSLFETLTDSIKPQAPMWACELTSKHFILSGVNSHQNRMTSKFQSEWPAASRPYGALASDGKGESFEFARPFVKDVLAEVGFKGSEIAIVTPDATTRIALLTSEKPSKDPEEQRTFIRWKLKKSVPFDVDAAQVAYRIVGPHRSGTGVDILVALAPRSVVQGFESLFEPLDIHAGLVTPSTLAALSLLTPPDGDALFVKVAPDCVTTTVFRNGHMQFYRRVTDAALVDAIYPTVLYYQDKLGGKALNRMYVCGYDADLRPSLQDVEERLGLTPVTIGPADVEDIFKPTLGAMRLKPETLL